MAMTPDELEGLLLVDKPSGPTSHDVVARVRRAVGLRRVGHAGTLDPMASGLLPLMLGRATRLTRFLPHSPKEYRGSLLLGRTTDTDDVTGRVLTTCEGELPPAATVVEAARAMEGTHMQTPPAYSARKVAGERLYRLARRGVAAEAPPTEVRIDRFRLEPAGEPGLYSFRVSVSAGTYVRALARDLGRELGCGGTLAELERTRIGELALEQAIALARDGSVHRVDVERALVPLERIPMTEPTLRLEDVEDARRFGHGVPVKAPTAGDGLLRVLGPNGSLLGVGEAGGGRVRPRVVLAPGESAERRPADG